MIPNVGLSNEIWPRTMRQMSHPDSPGLIVYQCPHGATFRACQEKSHVVGVGTLSTKGSLGNLLWPLFLTKVTCSGQVFRSQKNSPSLAPNGKYTKKPYGLWAVACAGPCTLRLGCQPVSCGLPESFHELIQMESAS